MPFYSHPSEQDRRYCSPACSSASRRQYEREEHTCRTCGRSFSHRPKPCSNSSGEFCSRRCRYDGALGLIHYDATRPAAGDRFGWRSRRNAFLRAGNDFCILCGKRDGRLHVHHIEGYRNTDYDDTRTVVTVCPRHHILFEAWTRLITRQPAPARRRLALLTKAVLGDLWCEHAGRALLAGGAPCN